MKNRGKTILLLGTALISILLWIQNTRMKNKLQAAKSEARTYQIEKDALVYLQDGLYKKLVADTLTRKELEKLAKEVVDLKNRKPISITRTIIQPEKIIKETDSIIRKGDSIFIEDYYPQKEDYFLKYTNRLSIENKKGQSNFDWGDIELKQVVSKKPNGLYRVDFKGPDFLKLKSLDIQTEPEKIIEKDRLGILVGAEYGKNLTTDQQFFEANLYQRINKFYIGGSVNTNLDFSAGIKVEL